MASNDVLPTLNQLDKTTLQSLGASAVPLPQNIDLTFFNHRLRKSTQLIGNVSEHNFIKARREWMDFDFVELMYVTTIRVLASGYEQVHELEISYENFLSNVKTEKTANYDGAGFTFRVNAFVGGFGLKPTERLFKDSKITSIEVDGVEQRHFGDVISLMTKLNAEVASVETHLDQYLTRAVKADQQYSSLTTKIAAISEEIDIKQQELEDVISEADAERSTLDDVKKTVAINESVRRNVDSQVQDLTAKVAALKDNSTSLAKEIQDKETTLRNLQSDINLFPTEISGYVTQGATNVRLYAALSLIPFFLVIGVTWRLFSNSEKILNYDGFGGRSIIEFLISRMPYVFVSFVILAICYTLLNRLISEVIGINRRRQDLFKISIIATEVSYASQNGLEISHEEAYNLRTETKMEMLKEHLRQHIGEDFVYNPKGNFFHKISKFVSRHVDEEETDKHKQ